MQKKKPQKTKPHAGVPAAGQTSVPYPLTLKMNVLICLRGRKQADGDLLPSVSLPRRLCGWEGAWLKCAVLPHWRQEPSNSGHQCLPGSKGTPSQKLEPGMDPSYSKRVWLSQAMPQPLGQTCAQHNVNKNVKQKAHFRLFYRTDI